MPRTRIDAELVIARLNREGLIGFLTRGEAVAIVAAQIRAPERSEREERNRVGTQLDRDGEDGKITQQADDHYLPLEVIGWARRRYGAHLFAGFPSTSRRVDLAADIQWSSTSRAELTNDPGKVETCHEIMRDQRREIKRLRAAIQEHSPQRRDAVGRFRRKD